MARIRTVKPELFKNEQLAELPVSARLLFIGLFCLADKEGRLEDRPKRIKAEVFPYDNVDINDQLTRLQSAGFIKRYEVGEMKVIQVVNFTKHQRITGSEALTVSHLPEQGNTGETLWQQQGLQEGKGKEGKERKEEAGEPPTPPDEKNKKFVKPTEEILTDFFEHECNLDHFTAQGQTAKFFNYYDSVGWKVGRNPMKDWKATARNWKDRMTDFKSKINGTNHHAPKTSSRNAGAYELLSKAKADYELITGGAKDT